MSVPVSTHEVGSHETARQRGLDGSGRAEADEDAAGQARGEEAGAAGADGGTPASDAAPAQVQPDGR